MVRDVAPDTFHCAGCGFFASQLPVSINGVERIDEDVRERALKPIRLANFRQLLGECADLLPQGAQLLDVGCAHGWFIEAATAHGLSCVGIEPDHDMERRARAAGHEVIAGFFPDAMADASQFDAITFNDVFEHLPDIQGTVRILPEFLHPGGVVIVNLPIADGLIFRLARVAARMGMSGPLDRMWQRGLPSPHLSYFTVETLQQLFHQAGFTLVRRGRLASVVLDGLYDRIRYDRSVGPLKAAGLYGAACVVRLMTGFFPSDIQYFAFRHPGR
jgi:SAM-dependent methyltransferase